MRSARIFLLLLPLLSASAQDRSFRIFGGQSGRYHCGGAWTDFQLQISPVSGPLGIVDEDAGVSAVLTFYFYRSISNRDGATYFLAGQYDAKTGRFHLEPKRWNTPILLFLK